LEGDLICSNKAEPQRSHPEGSSFHPACFRLSVSQLVTEISEEFQVIVNYVFLWNLTVFAIFTMPFLC
jgi:hypothetical protein